MLSSTLYCTALLLSLLTSGPLPLDIPALAGRAPGEVAAVVGPPTSALDPTVPSGEPEGGEVPNPLFEGVYATAEGGVLTVTYCGGRAASFHLRVPTGMPTAQALLARSGIQPESVETVAEGAGVAEWESTDAAREAALASETAYPLVRAVGTYTPEGWTELVVDFSVPC